MKGHSGWFALLTAISLGCSPGAGEEEDLGASGSATLDQRFAAVASRAVGFGGMFVDDEGNLAVHVRGDSDRALVLDAIAKVFPERATGPIRLIEGDFGFAELSRWYDAASELLGLPDVVFTDLDEKRNRVVIAVTNAAAMSAVTEEIAALGVPPRATIVEVADPVVNMATLRDRIRPLEGGLQIRFSRFFCTLGFNATIGGVKGFVVNSHCTGHESRVDGTRYFQPLNEVAEEFIGSELLDPPFFNSKDNPACPRRNKCRFSDAAFAEFAPDVSAPLGLLTRTTGPNNASVEIAGTFAVRSEADSNALVGETVNKVGRTTGWTQGIVTQRCVNVTVSRPRNIRLCQDFVNTFVGPGDSGSPVFRILDEGGLQLKGILWGGTSSGTTFVYSAIHLVKRELGELITFQPGDPSQ